MERLKVTFLYLSAPLLVALAVFSLTRVVMGGARMAFAGSDPMDQIEIGVAATLAVCVCLAMVIGDTVVRRGAKLRNTIEVPVYVPEFVAPDQWTQPEVETGDRLLEAELYEHDDDTPHRIVVLVKPSGLVKGYSAPLWGRALHFRMTSQVELPPELS